MRAAATVRMIDYIKQHIGKESDGLLIETLYGQMHERRVVRKSNKKDPFRRNVFNKNPDVC